MVQKKRILDKELRHELSKTDCHAIMDYLMVEFSERKDFHYNYYFDTPDGKLVKKDITLRLRTIVKDHDMTYHLTLKIPTIEKDTYLEYYEPIDEREMRLLAYNNKLPKGEIGELSSVHGNDVKLYNMIKVNRVYAMYLNQKVYFDRISHRGKTYYEIGTRIDQSQSGDSTQLANQFKALLQKFEIEFKQSPRRSKKYK